MYFKSSPLRSIEYSQQDLRGSTVFKQPSGIYLQLLGRLDADELMQVFPSYHL